tara:strand:+ start:256 stop:486 length:231 start_codon:yes stop_codon:yes gene_type:complete
MEVDGLAVVASGFGVELGHMVDVLLSEAAGIIDGGNLCRQWGEAGVSFFALFVAGLCGLAVASGMAFHGIWFCGLN